MQKVIHQEVEMYGYQSGETAFDSAFQRACSDIPDFSSTFENEILAQIVQVLQSTDQCGVLRITGLADRVDTPGLDREQIRQQEFQASVDRAQSAADGVFALVNSRMGGNLGADWGAVTTIVDNNVGAGACLLAESGASLTEAQRQRNRRVFFLFLQFKP